MSTVILGIPESVVKTSPVPKGHPLKRGIDEVRSLILYVNMRRAMVERMIKQHPPALRATPFKGGIKAGEPPAVRGTV